MKSFVNLFANKSRIDKVNGLMKMEMKIEEHKIEMLKWEDFEKNARNRKIVLYGVGNGAEVYFHRYKDEKIFLPEFIVDNDIMIQGHNAYQTVAECSDLFFENIKIYDFSKLKEYSGNQIVVVISSFLHYNEIAAQLEAEGVYDYFSVYCMEINALEGERNIIQDIIYDKFLQFSLKKKINQNKVCLLTWMGDFSGHGIEIARQLKRCCLDVDIIWLVMNLNLCVPEGIRTVWRKNKRCFLHEILTSKILLFDDNVLPDIPKREGQIYIQMKHWSSITLKMFGYDEARYRNDTKMMEGLCPGNIMDYVIVGSKFDEHTCRSGFDYHGKFIHAGSPRSDILFRRNDDMLESLCKRYDLKKDVRYLLYAPTYRLVKGEYSEIAYRSDMDFSSVKECLEQRFGGEWGILLRLHPFVAKKSKNISKPEYVIDVSDHHDPEELVALADVLVTDYSSIMFEPAYVKKPVFLLATDRKKYLNIERGFLLNYDKLPFPIAESNKELVANILNFDIENYKKDLKSFMQFYGVHEDGHASERAAEYILHLLSTQ